MTQFRECTVGDLLKETAASYPAHAALVYPQASLRLTYAELYATCRRVARGLMALGVKRGDHVAVWTTNLPEWVYLQYALGMVGGVLVTVNTSYRSSELEYILRQSDATMLILMERYRDAHLAGIAAGVLPELGNCTPGTLAAPELPYLKEVVFIGEKAPSPGMRLFSDLIARGATVTEGELDARMASLKVHDTINMQYTSGTTGFPKGVMLTHHNIVSNARLVGDVMGLGPEDRLLIHVPLFHCFGCVMSTLNCVCHGSAMVVVESFDAALALRYIEQERCTAINGVPTMFIAMLNHEDFERYDTSSLRTGIMAGAPCPVEVMHQVRARLHCPEVVIAFGQTESSPVMTMTRRDDPVELRVATVGRLLPSIEGRIVEPGTWEPLPPGVTGEIVTRSPCVMRGYYKMEEATREAIDHEGWLHTGDLGLVDEEGYFRVTGRIKEMIIRGGENIYPREIEEFLHGHPQVEDVYVVGIPDRKYGEQVLAVVRTCEGASLCPEELKAYCQGRIARHKIPRYWEFVSEFPMTASGKVQKYKLVDRFVSKYAA